jgi:hypothetical protein
LVRTRKTWSELNAPEIVEAEGYTNAITNQATSTYSLSHIEHIYMRIDATNRATASLFAVHGLLPKTSRSPPRSSDLRQEDEANSP